MPWQILLVLWILCGNVLGPILLKQLAAAPSRTRNLVWQCVFALIFSLIAAVIAGALALSWSMAVIALIGMVCAFAGYVYWLGVDTIGLSKTALFGQGGGIVAILLGFIILQEARQMNFWLWIGVSLSLGAVLVLAFFRARSGFGKDKTADKVKQRSIQLWLCACCLVWGLASFSMRYFSLNAVSPWSFAMAWYGGGLVGAGIVFALAGKKEAGQPLHLRNYLWILPRSFVICASLMFSCWTMKFAPITIVQPIVMISGLVFPIILGLWLFKETQNLSRWEKIVMLVGIIGGVIIALGY